MQNRPSILWAWVLSACFVAIVIRRYLIRPWRLRKFFVPREPSFVSEPIDEWPDEFKAPALISLRALAAQGYTALGYFKSRSLQTNGQTVYSAFWLDPLRNDVAMLSCRISPRFKGDDRISAELLLTRSFTDGTDCQTAVVNRMAFLPQPPTSSIICVAQVGNPADVIAVHRHWVERAGGDRKTNSFHQLDLAGEHRKFTDFLISSGEFRLNGDESTIVPTMRGMYVMTWRRLWPMWPRREMRDRSAAARVVRDWENAKQ